MKSEVIIIALLGAIVLQEIIHRFERRDLYSRIMAGSYKEFKKKGNVKCKTAHERAIDKWHGNKGGDS